jgi:hypothetical protein
MALDLAAADAGDVALGAAEASRPLFTLSQCRPVTLDGNMSADYAPENAAWSDPLTKPDDGRIGHDPMSIPLDILTASGHPPTSCSAQKGSRARPV